MEEEKGGAGGLAGGELDLDLVVRRAAMGRALFWFGTEAIVEEVAEVDLDEAVQPWQCTNCFFDWPRFALQCANCGQAAPDRRLRERHMIQGAEAVFQRVGNAFDGVVLGADGSSLHDAFANDYVGDAFLRALPAEEREDWRRIFPAYRDSFDLSTLRRGIPGCYPSSFLNLKGLRFHLPAMMSEALRILQDDADASACVEVNNVLERRRRPDCHPSLSLNNVELSEAQQRVVQAFTGFVRDIEADTA